MLRTIYPALGVVNTGCEPFFEDGKIPEVTKWVSSIANFCRFYHDYKESVKE